MIVELMFLIVFDFMFTINVTGAILHREKKAVSVCIAERLETLIILFSARSPALSRSFAAQITKEKFSYVKLFL